MPVKRAGERKDGALPTIADQTNIGDRNTASADAYAVKVEEGLEPVAPPPPVPASGPDYEIAPIVLVLDPAPPQESTIAVLGLGEIGAIAFVEVNDRHPEGQVIIMGGQTVSVVPTFRVHQAISEGRLLLA